jgi:UDP-MurNAc hydroxylase
MHVTGLGHASVLIETAHGSIVTDPWVNPAFYASWFPFPDNSALDWDQIARADYLFVSHLHRDHFDPENLRRHFRRDIPILLPAYPTTELHDALLEVGFTSFIETVSEEIFSLDGLEIMIQSLISPTDGPIGDSSLWVYDGEHRLLNQNDARPSNLDVFTELGPVDAYLLQFSGAIWYPMVYDLPARAKHALGVSKRERQLDRSLRYIDEMGARFVFPTAGPPCFLDPDLFDLNDIHGDESNIFPDQTVYLEWLAERGHDEARLLIPGSRCDLGTGAVTHPVDPDTIFGDKTAYLRAYQARQLPVIEAARASWAQPEMDVSAELKSWLEPLLAEADYMAAGIDGGVRLIGEDAERGDVDLIIDFVARMRTRRSAISGAPRGRCSRRRWPRTRSTGRIRSSCRAGSPRLASVSTTSSSTRSSSACRTSASTMSRVGTSNRMRRPRPRPRCWAGGRSSGGART